MAAVICSMLDGDDIERLKALDVPQEVIWERAGFSPEEIDRMMAMKHSEALLDASRTAIPSDY
jgi:hypothetical protein